MARYVRKKARVATPLPTGIDEPNWAAIITVLRARGHSMAGLAAACTSTRQILYSIWYGTTEPYWYTGQALLEIYKLGETK